MVQPYNYTFGGPSAGDMAFEGYEQGLGIQRAKQVMDLANSAEQREAEIHPLKVQEIKAGIEARRAAAGQQRAEAARQGEFRAAMGTLYEKGTGATLDDALDVAAQFPEFGAAIQETWSSMDDAKKGGVATTLAQIGSAIKSGNTDLAKRLTDDYAKAARNGGDEGAAATAEAMSGIIEIDPDAAYASLLTTLAVTDPEMAERLGGRGQRVQTSTPLFGGGAQLIMSDGTIQVRTPDNRVLEGQDAEDFVRAAQEDEVQFAGEKAGTTEAEKLSARAEGAGAVKAAEKLAEITVEQANSAYEDLQNVRRNTGTIAEAIRAIDNGAKSGAVQKYLPNITKASADLENAMSRMGLDVISSVTFGALSGPEMNLAMETAVPRNLDGEDLRKWLVEKREALEKAETALFNAARYLSTPGNTLNSWLEENSKPEESGPNEQFRRFVKPDISDDDLQRFIAINSRARAGTPPTAEERRFLEKIRR